MECGCPAHACKYAVTVIFVNMYFFKSLKSKILMQIFECHNQTKQMGGESGSVKILKSFLCLTLGLQISSRFEAILNWIPFLGVDTVTRTSPSTGVFSSLVSVCNTSNILDSAT